MTIANGSSVAAPIALIYSVNEDFYTRAMEGLTEAQLWYRPAPDCNPILWIAGHVAQVRTSVLKLMGESYDTQWGELFGRGASLLEPEAYPSAADVLRTMTAVSTLLRATLESLDDARLSQPAIGAKLPNAKTLADQIAFLALHDSYHIGQMGYLHKALRSERLVG